MSSLTHFNLYRGRRVIRNFESRGWRIYNARCGKTISASFDEGPTTNLVSGYRYIILPNCASPRSESAVKRKVKDLNGFPTLEVLEQIQTVTEYSHVIMQSVPEGYGDPIYFSRQIRAGKKIPFFMLSPGQYSMDISGSGTYSFLWDDFMVLLKTLQDIRNI